MFQKTDWNNLFKVRIANPDDSFQKHEIIKLLVVMKLLNKYRRRDWIRIYTEFDINGLKPDIYFEHIKEKSIICYEIQKDYSDRWMQGKKNAYTNYRQYGMTVDFIPIPLKEAPDNILELNEWLDKYVF